MSHTNELTPENRELLKACFNALEDTKADGVLALDVSKQSTITNYLILASANSEPHMRALRRDLDKTLKERKVKIIGTEEGKETGWSVVDAFDVMIHLFTQDMRANYDLERLWKDAKRIEIEQL